MEAAMKKPSEEELEENSVDDDEEYTYYHDNVPLAAEFYASHDYKVNFFPYFINFNDDMSGRNCLGRHLAISRIRKTILLR